MFITKISRRWALQLVAMLHYATSIYLWSPFAFPTARLMFIFNTLSVNRKFSCNREAINKLFSAIRAHQRQYGIITAELAIYTSAEGIHSWALSGSLQFIKRIQITSILETAEGQITYRFLLAEMGTNMSELYVEALQAPCQNEDTRIA